MFFKFQPAWIKYVLFVFDCCVYITFYLLTQRNKLFLLLSICFTSVNKSLLAVCVKEIEVKIAVLNMCGALIYLAVGLYDTHSSE